MAWCQHQWVPGVNWGSKFQLSIAGEGPSGISGAHIFTCGTPVRLLVLPLEDLLALNPTYHLNSAQVSCVCVHACVCVCVCVCMRVCVDAKYVIISVWLVVYRDHTVLGFLAQKYHPKTSLKFPS